MPGWEQGAMCGDRAGMSVQDERKDDVFLSLERAA